MNRRRFSWACLLAVTGWLAFITFTADPPLAEDTHVVTIPCRPVAGECTGTADIPPGTELVIFEPGDGADMVRRQILDLHRRTP